eukprot:TRINITY_DN3627_c0_g1_i8.p6 TRINITY_DN3627_c0_g1~~TRINITY_DN3627_c0_g1_i8.p6  ORF type:complete len:102 (+),score=3.74 TRINITY_DN3627_c0_g1_i8:419-724(+)
MIESRKILRIKMGIQFACQIYIMIGLAVVKKRRGLPLRDTVPLIFAKERQSFSERQKIRSRKTKIGDNPMQNKMIDKFFTCHSLMKQHNMEQEEIGHRKLV